MASTQARRGQDIGIDLGTANTLVYLRGKGIVLNEPSVVAMDKRTGEVLSVGAEAKRTLGRTPGDIVAGRPLQDGVIADFEGTRHLLRHLLAKVTGKPGRFFGPKPRVVVCVPSGITGVERRAVIEAVSSAGARSVHLIEEPMAAAIGAGLPVQEPTGSMVVDIGGGTTEVAVLSMGGIVAAQSLRCAGDRLDAAIIRQVKKDHGLLIGERTAEEIKLVIGSADPDAFEPEEPTEVEVRGRDAVQGLPRTAVVTAEQVRAALDEPVDEIVAAVKLTLDEVPPELSGDVMGQGITLTGGGALLRGLSRRLSRETGLPVRVAENPLDCVAVGSGQCVEEVEALRRVFSVSA
ncbi:Cell-shape determining protein [Kitasatospora sp. MMS16-BH015]|uniref:rod shape-determining protein n=1 Tax=Kitasatospora sp. MMS16-BH015 TaxID=2018025 RepID=UPI000CA13F52|nr:rod shape-determining protein [Kitasatospora sp. MMS16-BH015]AUG77221.1 Cell-shape determining protein [Kitasatospora sp. MMS16-BH015]